MSSWDAMVDRIVSDLELTAAVASLRQRSPDLTLGLSDDDLWAGFVETRDQVEAMGVEAYCRDVLGHTEAETAELLARAAESEAERAQDPSNRPRSP